MTEPDRWEKVPAPVEDLENVILKKGKAPMKATIPDSDVDWVEGAEAEEEVWAVA
ncbi:hypothetical protein PbJCM13498_02220 [Prolixibacter bellariivorans]|uniref:Uncharacterized protein n=1 Tax=Prolixibacter bellariivorans TaxID=314319 RepID=A0A5M4ATV1_9BACT|nr:hypothetical protein PbJCM13498_02220 [Prolixibacter bellariivorans]